ncbi:carbamoyltransferase HypF [Winogradskyella sp. A2]|uniref:carbamoyltransferase HypF n=1 Tax=Winogradskyella sp. A2 TaxID=3366944 RepID=UPI00398C4D79
MKTYKIVITGQVQGVGFRPYVYTLAKQFNLKGTVSNNEEGVIICAHGSKDAVNEFYDTLINHPPKVSKIDEHYIVESESMIFQDFRIIPSKVESKLNLQLTPDFAICESCQQDISDPKNRRYNYPYTTCVDCGPRWAITKTFPFERHHTSMKEFDMCNHCQEEYSNPENRRFHSQTNSCSTCGIEMYLIDITGKKLEIDKNSIFNSVKEFLLNGSILAIKNTSGYLLCCDARNEAVVKNLRLKKNRPQKPFALLYPSLKLLKSHFQITNSQESSLVSPERPIVILPKLGSGHSEIASSVAPNLNQLGIMLPNSSLLQLIANEIDFPIVGTSGNISGSPILRDNDEAFEKLKSIADYFVQHDLDIIHPQDDSVLKFSQKYSERVLFRRSRGYAPNYFNFKNDSDKIIMAVGAHLKSTIAFLPNDYLYVSQYLGHLDNYDSYQRFVEIACDFISIFREDPQVILVDKHPAYQSTLYGKSFSKKFNAEVYEIQHHKAHFASVLAEHKLFEDSHDILGVVWDGTGFGDDQQIWGGEFFRYHNRGMQRVAHFEYYNWLANDKMAKNPKLSLLSLMDNQDESVLSKKFTTNELDIYETLKERNNLETSSVGRLFDAVASLLDICDYNSYEGEAAIKLENLVTQYDLKNCKAYVSVLEDGSIPTKIIINKIKDDVEEGIENSKIIINFLYTLASIILQIAKQQHITKIACSGGVFQNTMLIDMLKELARDDFELFFNRNLSPNDENISLGQMMYYLHGIDTK